MSKTRVESYAGERARQCWLLIGCPASSSNQSHAVCFLKRLRLEILFGIDSQRWPRSTLALLDSASPSSFPRLQPPRERPISVPSNRREGPPTDLT